MGYTAELNDAERELQEIREFEARLRERDERRTKKVPFALSLSLSLYLPIKLTNSAGCEGGR